MKFEKGDKVILKKKEYYGLNRNQYHTSIIFGPPTINYHTILEVMSFDERDNTIKCKYIYNNIPYYIWLEPKYFKKYEDLEIIKIKGVSYS